ncbi:MAG: hypothetical protein Fur007_07630 [Rhodoferax sp.]
MLELRQLHYRWGERVLLADVTLRVGAGEVVALLGPSGSGKSTLLALVAGLLRPHGGSVWFDGVDQSAVPVHRRRFALMFQDFALFAHLDVCDNVAFGLIEQGLARAAARAQARAMLEVFGLAGHARRRVWQLSGGEQQRVALARALITQPRVLLLDEPFSALDAQLRAGLRDEFARRIRSADTPTLLVTHDPAEAQAMAQRIVRLHEGRLVEEPLAP